MAISSTPTSPAELGKGYLAEARDYKEKHGCRWSEATRFVKKKHSGGDANLGLEVAQAMQAATEAERKARLRSAS